jgi:hypothetical protein
MDPDVVERYLLLGLQLGQHIDGLVDAYYGPAELAERVRSQPLVPPAEIAREAAVLRKDVADIGDPQRARWLSAQLEGAAASAERLAGRPITYVEEIRRCYGIDLEPASEDELADAHLQLERLVPGTGSLRERYVAWRRTQEMPPDAVLPALEAVNREIRARTNTLYGLPEGEVVEMELVSNQPWSGFNYYLGGLRSRIAINTDVPVRPQFLVLAAAHEMYPGHHTEHAWKEALLVRGRDFLEESIFLIGTPQSLIAEGIATCALGALGAAAEYACAALLADMGWGYDVDLARAVRAVERPLSRAWHNFALMVHEYGRDVDEARAFVNRWVLDSEEEIAKRIEFVLHPVWRAYIVVYAVGERLVEAWTHGDPGRYRRLLTEQLTTVDLIRSRE